MRHRLTRRGTALAAGTVTAVLTAAVAFVVARPGGPGHPALPTVVDLSPGAVRRLAVEAAGRHAELVRTGHGWTAGPDTIPGSAPLLVGAEDRLFPMRAYRVVRADAADPQYGLADPSAVVRLEARSGRRVAVRLGAATFTGAGFYATQDGDPGRLYLVPRNTLELLTALTTGERVETADPLQKRTGRYGAEQDDAGRSKEMPIYLRQVLDAGGQAPPPEP